MSPTASRKPSDDHAIEYPIWATGEGGLFRFDLDEGELLEIGDLDGCPALGELPASPGGGPPSLLSSGRNPR